MKSRPPARAREAAPLAVLNGQAGRQAGRTERPSPADLNATATRHGGYAIVGGWAQGNPGITTTQRRKLAKAVDDLIAAQGDPALMPAALDEVHRPGWRDPIKALPHAYDRVRRDRNPAPLAPLRTAPRESTTDRAVAEVHNVFAALRAEHAFQENPAQTALIEGTG